MKKITLTKSDYEDIIYPILSSAMPETYADLRSCDKIMNKLEAQGEPETIKQPDPTGQMVEVDTYVMNGDSKDFELEDPEAAYLLTRLVSVLTILPASRTRQLLPLIDILEA